MRAGDDGALPHRGLEPGRDQRARPMVQLWIRCDWASATMQSTVSPNPATNVVTGTTYGPAGEPLTISMAGRPAETRTYNSLLQLTSLNESTFVYPAGLNNGRIQSETNTATGSRSRISTTL